MKKPRAMQNLSPYDMPAALLSSCRLRWPYDVAWIPFDPADYRRCHGERPLQCLHELRFDPLLNDFTQKPTQIHLRGHMFTDAIGQRWALVTGQCPLCFTIYYTIPGEPLGPAGMAP